MSKQSEIKITLPANAQDLKGFREFMSGLRTSYASAATIYEGPTKTLFDEVAAKFKTILDGLPAESNGDWCLTDKLDWLFDSLSGARSICDSLLLELSKAKTTASAAALETAVAAGTHLTKEAHDAAVTAAVDAAIAKRTAADGDLVPQDRVNQLCSAAQLKGINEGREQLKAEMATALAAEQTATARTTALTTAGLPLPDADVAAILREPEEKFAAAKTLAQERLAAFTTAGITLEGELAAGVWLPENEFKKFHKTVSAIPALRRAAPAAEPFATPPAGGGGATSHRILG